MQTANTVEKPGNFQKTGPEGTAHPHPTSPHTTALRGDPPTDEKPRTSRIPKAQNRTRGRRRKRIRNRKLG